MVHGEEEANKAQESARALFAGGSAANMPEAVITEDKFTEGQIDILSVLVASGLCSSRNEARRAVEQGGVSVNDEKVADIKTAYVPSDFADGLILKRGKKSFRRVIM